MNYFLLFVLKITKTHKTFFCFDLKLETKSGKKYINISILVSNFV